MAPPTKQDSFKQLISLFKEGYNPPIKTYAWAKVLTEWGRVGMGTLILLVIGSVILLTLFSQSKREQTQLDQMGETLVSSLQDTITFIDIGKRSLDKREELLKELMELANRSSEQPLDQKGIESKRYFLFTLLETCRAARRSFIDALSKAKNPILNPEISDSFAEIIKEEEGMSLSREKPSIITLQEENSAWENLCWLCEKEIKRSRKGK